MSYGVPPHVGISVGLDRLLSLYLCDSSDIRTVLPFPKAASGRDLLLGAPSALGEEELGELAGSGPLPELEPDPDDPLFAAPEAEPEPAPAAT